MPNKTERPRNPGQENLMVLQEIKALKATLATKQKQVDELTAKLKASNEELAKFYKPAEVTQ